MLKALLKLVLLTLVPLIYLLLADNYSPLHYYEAWYEERFMSSIYLGSMQELETQLLNVEEDKRQNLFDSFTKAFGTELKLVELKRDIISSRKLDRLNSGELVVLGDDTTIVSHKVGESNWVITVASEETTMQETHRLARGPFFLLNRLLEEIPLNQLPDKISSLETRFGWKLKLISIEEEHGMKMGKQLYQFEEIEWIQNSEDNSDSETFFMHLSSNLTLTITPLYNRPLEIVAIMVVISTFVFFASIGLVLWLWPLWHDHKKITNAAMSFGNGHLDSRVNIGKGSFASYLGESFNNMAENIQSLITANQNLTNAVAHDLRTPLARLGFANEMLANGQCSDEELQRYHLTINNSIDALNYLVSQSLMHSRYNRVTDIKHFSECNFALEILDEVDQYRFESDAIVFDVHIEQRLMDNAQFVDSKALRRALGNLLSNAVKHANGHIKVNYFYAGEYICLSVEDNGKGIKEGSYEKVFQPYAQLENTERNNSHSLGLGLSIVKHIMLWHKGSVEITQSSMGGALFTLSWQLHSNK